MKLLVTVKSLGKRKPALARQEIELSPAPETLRDLITATVALNVQKLRDKQESVALIPFLTGEEVEAQGEIGKVGFGSVYNDGVPDIKDAVNTAMQALKMVYTEFLCVTRKLLNWMLLWHLRMGMKLYLYASQCWLEAYGRGGNEICIERTMSKNISPH